MFKLLLRHTRRPADIPHWNASNVWGAHIYSAPTLGQVQGWLSTKGLFVEATYVFQDGESLYDWNVYDMRCGELVDCNSGASLKTHETALADGIAAALRLMTEGGEDEQGD